MEKFTRPASGWVKKACGLTLTAARRSVASAWLWAKGSLWGRRFSARARVTSPCKEEAVKEWRRRIDAQDQMGVWVNMANAPAVAQRGRDNYVLGSKSSCRC